MSQHEEVEDLSDYGLFDEANPRSLLNIVPARIKDAIVNMDKQLFLLDEDKLKKKVKPSSTLNYIRLAFWLEYNRAQDFRKPMLAKNITKGVSNADYLFHVVLGNDLYLAWMLTPPTDYALVQMDILNSGLDRLRKAMSIPLYITTEKFDEGGNLLSRTKRPNIAAIEQVRKIVAMLSDRVQGSIVQKLAIKTHSTSGGQLTPQQYDPGALDDLNRTLQGLDQRLGLAAASESVISMEETPIPPWGISTDEPTSYEPAASPVSGVETVEGELELDLGDQTDDGLLID